ncbi:NodT family RND efflux system outer membrane lipoprotein [Burkholderiales bacterium GJ-E10]|nr:NodT family RND efflux system outer membrane lipoprotein [Burkholderiales bacterium GJ-E10]
MMKTMTRRVLPIACAMLLAGCMVGPDYRRPAVDMPPAWKEQPGWTRAQPAAAQAKGEWWRAFHDPLLDDLEPLVAVSNQTVRQSYASYEQALASLRIAQAGLFPILTVTGQRTRQNTPASFGIPGQLGTVGSAAANVSWTPDIWGQIRRQIEESRATAQSDQALLANATLSEQIALAQAVIDLRVVDADTDLLQRTVIAYRRFLQVVAEQDRAGTVAPSQVVAAQTQLDNARASLIALGVARAQYAHAIAVLVGKNPEDLAIARSRSLPFLPTVAAGLPSTLLQRRPDVAAAERQMAAANAAIGVATAAYYPTVTLLGSYGVSPLAGLLQASNRAWSLGANASELVFNGGQNIAEVALARAGYQATVANYRNTVLGALQSVENDLAGLRILARQADALAIAVRDATRGSEIALHELEAGTVDYTTVAIALTTQFGDEQSALTVHQQRLLDTVALIGDLGGGWTGLQP